MKESLHTLSISDAIGAVSLIDVVPAQPRAVMTLAHGAGADMNHSFMRLLAEALAARQIATVRFNFPYMEKKRGRPDVPAVAHATIARVAASVQERYATLPCFLSGKSFGGRMSSQYLAASSPAWVKGIVFYGFPLHPAGKPGVERAAHLNDVQVPMLFLQGTRDTLAELPLITNVCAALPLANLVLFEKADHSFKAGKQNNIDALADATVQWMDAHI